MNNVRATVLNRGATRSGKQQNRLAKRSNVLYAEGITKGALFMTTARSKQAGFSVVQMALVIAATGIIGAAGLFVYQHKRTEVIAAAANPNQLTNQQPTTAPAPAQNTVQIPELGIQITVPNDIKDLTYQTSTVTLRSGQKATLAMFSTKALTSADAGCSAAAGPFGSLERVDAQ